MKKLILAVTLAFTLAGCSGISPLSLLTGGGPNVAANVQAGKTNTQTLGTTQITEQKLVSPQAETIEQTGTVNNTNVDPWIIALLCLFAGFVIPSPNEIAAKMRGLLRGRRSASEGQ